MKSDLIVYDDERGWYAKSLPYGSNVGAPPIKPENINAWKQSNVGKVNKYFESKFNELLKELNELRDEYEYTKLIYSAKYNFEPIVGESYYLYKNDNEYFLSLISPNEWKINVEFIGEFQLDTKNKWVKI